MCLLVAISIFSGVKQTVSCDILQTASFDRQLQDGLLRLILWMNPEMTNQCRLMTEIRNLRPALTIRFHNFVLQQLLISFKRWDYHLKLCVSSTRNRFPTYAIF